MLDYNGRGVLQVALVRMMSDGRLPVAERRNYKHVGNAIVRMASEEGVLVLWRGIQPAMLRAMMGSVSQLVSYSQTKRYLIKHGKYCLHSLLFCKTFFQ